MAGRRTGARAVDAARSADSIVKSDPVIITTRSLSLSLSDRIMPDIA